MAKKNLRQPAMESKDRISPPRRRRDSSAKRAAINSALALIFQAIERLRKAFPHRKFTIDGRLVGDVGEVIAALEYEVVLDGVSQAVHDAVTSDGRRVQIKATFKEQLTFKTVPDFYLGFKLYADGRHEEVYNGPGSLISKRYSSRKGLGTKLLSLPITELRRLSVGIPPASRIPKRRPK